MKPLALLGVVALMLAVTAAVIVMQEGQRKIQVQYAKRVVGRRVYGGQSTHIPLRINTAGVIPVIFASSLILFPATLARFIPTWWIRWCPRRCRTGAPRRAPPLSMGFIFFIFYTRIFNPNDRGQHEKYGGTSRSAAAEDSRVHRQVSRGSRCPAMFLADSCCGLPDRAFLPFASRAS
jgi:preprotein translocase subunit SecY